MRRSIRARVGDTKHQQARTLNRKVVFLRDYALCGVVLRSAQAAGIGRRTVQNWCRDDPNFKRLFDEAAEDALDIMEEEARARAADGWLEPVFQGGRKVGHIRKKSDALMMMFLKGKRKHLFSERQEVTGAGSGAVQVNVTLAAELDPPETEEEKAYRLAQAKKPTKALHE